MLQSRMYKERGESAGWRQKGGEGGYYWREKKETVGKSHGCAEDVYYFQVVAEAEHTLPCHRD